MARNFASRLDSKQDKAFMPNLEKSTPYSKGTRYYKHVADDSMLQGTVDPGYLLKFLTPSIPL